MLGFYDCLGGNPTMIYHKLPLWIVFGIPMFGQTNMMVHEGSLVYVHVYKIL